MSLKNPCKKLSFLENKVKEIAGEGSYSGERWASKLILPRLKPKKRKSREIHFIRMVSEFGSYCSCIKLPQPLWLKDNGNSVTVLVFGNTKRSYWSKIKVMSGFIPPRGYRENLSPCFSIFWELSALLGPWLPSIFKISKGLLDCPVFLLLLPCGTDSSTFKVPLQSHWPW